MELDLKKLDKDHIPSIYKFPKVETIVNKYSLDIKTALSIPFPKGSYGFQHFIHQSKENMEVTEQFKGKKKIYHIMSKFEKYIDDYEEDLANLSTKYFNLKTKPELICRESFKLWEMLILFDLVGLEKPNFRSVHLAEGPGSFVQSTLLYREQFGRKDLAKNDKYFCITVDPKKVKDAIPFNQKFIDYYNKNDRPKRLMIDYGDLTDIKVINNFVKNVKDKVNFVTADGGFTWENENLQEQEILPLLLGQIITALKLQNKGANFVLKIYESYTEITVKLICSLTSFYKETMIFKPLSSRKSNSEKYVIFKDFQGINNKDIGIYEKIFEETLDKKNHISDIFPKFKISKEIKGFFIEVNTTIANKQFQNINEIIEFIKRQNYRGEEYQKRRNMQIEATKYWVNLFYPDSKKLKEQQKITTKFVNDIISNNNKKIEILNSKLN